MTALALNSDIRTIRLSGVLGRKFGRIHRLAVDTPAEAIRALCTTKPGFRAELETPGNCYRVLVGKEPVTDAERELHMQHSPAADYTFAPTVQGSKNALGQILVGVALIGLSFIPGVNVLAGGAAIGGWGAAIAGMAFNVGVALVIGGVAQMLTPMPKSGNSDRPENKPNTQFNGAVNTQAQGNPVPLAYGELITGSAVVSAGLSSGFLAAGVAVPETGGSGGTGGGSAGTGSFTPGAGTGYYPDTVAV